jgi:hypothetical protein
VSEHTAKKKRGLLRPINPGPLVVKPIPVCAICNMRAPWCTCGKRKYRLPATPSSREDER